MSHRTVHLVAKIFRVGVKFHRFATERYGQFFVRFSIVQVKEAYLSYHGAVIAILRYCTQGNERFELKTDDNRVIQFYLPR